MTDKYIIWEGRLKGIQLKNKEEKDKKTLREYINYRPIIRDKATISKMGTKKIIVVISIIKTKG